MATTLIYHGKDAVQKKTNDFSELESLHVRDLYALDEQDKEKKKKDKKFRKNSSSSISKRKNSKLGDAPAGSESEVMMLNKSSTTRSEEEEEGGSLRVDPPTRSLSDGSTSRQQLEPEGSKVFPVNRPRRHHSGGESSSRHSSSLPPPPPPPPPPPVRKTSRTPFIDESMKDASDITDVTASASMDASSPDSRCRKSSRTGSGTLKDLSDISASRSSRRRGERRVGSNVDPPTASSSSRKSRQQRIQARASVSVSESMNTSAPDATGTSTRHAETLRRSATQQVVPTHKTPGKSKSHSPSRPARISRRHRHHTVGTAAQALMMEDKSMPEQQLVQKEQGPAYRRANSHEEISFHKRTTSHHDNHKTVEGILYFTSTATKEGQPITRRRTTVKGRVIPPPPPPPTHSPSQKAKKTKRRSDLMMKRDPSEASLSGSNKSNNNNEPPGLVHLTNDLLE